MRVYSRDEVLSASLEYFKGDQLAANTFLKYALKDRDGNYYEDNPDQMHRRLAKDFARIEEAYGGERQLSEDQIYNYLKDFKYIVPQGSPMSGIGNDFVNVSLSNCNVVASPKDNMSSILDTGRDLANLFKRRFGCGLDISTLRPEGAAVSNAAGSSSGAWTFSDLYSFITRMVGQNNRRGALMITMDVRHPDIEKFITMKHDKSKVTGANVSVKISNDFMKAVKEDTDFVLKFPVDSNNPKFTRTIKAKQLWDLIVSSATNTAEPGILMWDNILDYLPAQAYWNHVATNPCGELPLCEYDSCRLISINLNHFIDFPFTDKAKFNWRKYHEVVSVAQRLSDDLVELELEKLQNLIDIADTEDEKQLFKKLRSKCFEGRRTGLGTHGLADCLARLCLPYDGDEALKIINSIYETLKLDAYGESVELAKERGAFPIFNWETEKNNLFIQSLEKYLRNDIAEHGRRNISLLTNAPTGSVSIVSQTSSGIEPVFQNSYVRRKKKNHDELPSQDDFVDQNGDRWLQFEVFHHNLQEWIDLNHGEAMCPPFFSTSATIDWTRRVEVQAAIQKHIDHSISSTINLPKGTPVEVVSELYMKAWEKGLKGVTVYVAESRSGVLITKEEKQNKNTIEYKDALKRPTELECDIHHVSIKGEKWIVLIGLVDNLPYEIFSGRSENIEISKKHTKGIIKKMSFNKTKPNRYDLHIDDFVIKDVVKMFDNTYQVLSRMISLGLRHGASPNFVMEQLTKGLDDDLSNFSRVLARTLKKYVKDGTKVSSDKLCPECKKEELIYSEGCVVCRNCGWGKC